MPWRRLEERRYSSYSFSTSTLDGVSGQRHAPAALKWSQVPIVHRAAWAPKLVCTQRLEEKSSRLCRGSKTIHAVIANLRVLIRLLNVENVLRIYRHIEITQCPFRNYRNTSDSRLAREFDINIDSELALGPVPTKGHLAVGWDCLVKSLALASSSYYEHRKRLLGNEIQYYSLHYVHINVWFKISSSHR
jgi:hypothetical protein